MRDNYGAPDRIIVRGGRVHNLKNIDVDIPLNKIVGIAGESWLTARRKKSAPLRIALQVSI